MIEIIGFRANSVLELSPSIPSCAPIERRRKARLKVALGRTLDRVNVLGKDRQGHTGCVNALSWATGGELLLSGGDDTTVRIWKMDPSNLSQEYPFISRCTIRTGHQANIFSAQMLPHSSRIATAAGDNQVRVFDIQGSLPASIFDPEAELSNWDSCAKVIQCHSDRVKRIITEDSPELFLSVAEDGTVRQHDLRAFHTCSRDSCPAPLVELEQELCTLSLSPLTPYQFVVAGNGPYGYLYDRRHSRRMLEANWGELPHAGEELTTCVRKFGTNSSRGQGRRMRITGARMSASDGHEVILSYSGDGVYLFSALDEPGSHQETRSSLVPPNASASPKTWSFSVIDVYPKTIVSGPNDEELSDEGDPTGETTDLPQIPVIFPRRGFTGARNVETIKDVNFLGPNDEWVTSGSDDGNFFIWNKSTGTLHGIYEGDSSVVNMVEGHPTLPLIAISGIDTTVKLFAPTQTPSAFSRIADADMIMEMNQRPRRTRMNLDGLAALLGGEIIRISPAAGSDCVNQ